MRRDLLGPYRTLALRVISLAVQDLITPGHAASERETARAFFAGSRMLGHWCRVAEIDQDAVRRYVRKALRDSALPLHRRH